MNNRKRCTKDTPSDGKPYEWYHPDAKMVDSKDYSDGSSYDTYECPWCHIIFTTEVAQ